MFFALNAICEIKPEFVVIFNNLIPFKFVLFLSSQCLKHKTFYRVQ